jgi:hypothetical protein
MLFQDMEELEKKITDIFAFFVGKLLFFLRDDFKSVVMTLLHYIFFIVGIYTFYFVVKPGSPYKILFFLLSLLAYILFLTFDKCLCSSIEYALHNDRNLIQHFMNDNFGDGEEGKTVSKSVLLMITLFLGLSILYDYRILRMKLY